MVRADDVPAAEPGSGLPELSASNSRKMQQTGRAMDAVVLPLDAWVLTPGPAPSQAPAHAPMMSPQHAPHMPHMKSPVPAPAMAPTPAPAPAPAMAPVPAPATGAAANARPFLCLFMLCLHCAWMHATLAVLGDVCLSMLSSAHSLLGAGLWSHGGSDPHADVQVALGSHTLGSHCCPSWGAG